MVTVGAVENGDVEDGLEREDGLEQEDRLEQLGGAHGPCVAGSSWYGP